MKTINRKPIAGTQTSKKSKALQAYTLIFASSSNTESIVLESGTFTRILRKRRFPKFGYAGRRGAYTVYRCNLNNSCFILTVQNFK